MSLKKNISNLNGKNVIVTGSSGLIGSAVVQELKNIGANPICLDIHPGEEPDVFTCDLSDEKSIEETINYIKKDFQSINGIVNAHQYKPKYFLNQEIENFSSNNFLEILKTNLIGTLLVCDLVVQNFECEGLSIVNFGSTYGRVSSNPKLYENNSLWNPVYYSVSKSGINMMTKWLAVHWASKKIRINTIIPHGVENNHDKKFIESFKNLSPLNRMSSVEEVVGPVIFLLSDSSTYMTGSELVVDGGWSAW